MSTTTPHPLPLTIPPLRPPHLQTLILLHGRGSNAPAFGPLLLSHPISPTQTLRSALPHASFVFPTASKRRAALYKRALIPQWFDHWRLRGDGAEEEREELQVEGLRETSGYVGGLAREEVGKVGVGNVVLGGLSQGCAAVVVAMLVGVGVGVGVGGVVGLCGWLPYRRRLEEAAGEGDGEEEDWFERVEGDGRDGGGEGEGEEMRRAVGWLREELEVKGTGTGSSLSDIPLFLGHGVEDDSVDVELGREARDCMRTLGVKVEWREYEGLGHWYSEEMLADMMKFVKEEVGWEVEGST